MFMKIVLGLFLINHINSLSIPNGKCLNHCSNDAMCAVESGTPQCYCLPEWDGDRCDIRREISTSYQFLDKNSKLKNEFRSSPCDFYPNLCNGKGLCFLNGTKLACTCIYPNAGARCDEISVCKDYCFHDEICKVEDGNPKCDCGDLYDGARCQSVKTTSSTIPPSTTTDVICSYAPDDFCKNGGSCINRNNVAACQCPPTHSGANCEIPVGGTQGPGVTNPGQIGPGVTNPSGRTDDACSSNPCLNNQPCYNTGNSYFCLCRSPYAGSNCQNSG